MQLWPSFRDLELDRLSLWIFLASNADRRLRQDPRWYGEAFPLNLRLCLMSRLHFCVGLIGAKEIVQSVQRKTENNLGRHVRPRQQELKSSIHLPFWKHENLNFRNVECLRPNLY